jgi:hypothetical protein
VKPSDDPPINFWDYAILRAAHQADLRVERDNLTGREREQCLFLVGLGEQVLRALRYGGRTPTSDDD